MPDDPLSLINDFSASNWVFTELLLSDETVTVLNKKKEDALEHPLSVIDE